MATPPSPHPPTGAISVTLAEQAETAGRRRPALRAITYPAELPITAAREELLAAIADFQVVVVAGETGSGKTTQLPKLCAELGRGVRGRIGHTQPRRIAARTVAARIADELGVTLGREVGYQVRFDDKSSDATLIKLMTDGILLAEIQRDRLLAAYDTIIIDEAHERSLNIDFLLGYLAQLLPRRPDLKLIITSATIDPARFAAHFGDAPIIEVSGRTYPVETRYRPMSVDDDDQVQGICDAVVELFTEPVDGDILVFLSGEREIRDAFDALRALDLAGTEILPLYARLSTGEQQRVFQPHRRRRVVLATNVAETSLTVPGIRFVVDPGTARISRYSNRTKVQRLPIEKVSQASANQRAGRCGRVAPGICIRLYDEADFLGRPDFTDPEILRTNLAAVILAMTALGLGDVADFPFLDPPDQRSVKDAVQLLTELGAVQTTAAPYRLTPVGRVLATLPVDPRLGRMIVEADRNACLREVLVLAAFLSIADPRERPSANRHGADAQHARFVDEASDFIAVLRLWDYVRDQQRALSSGAFRRQCKTEFIHFLRVREWQDLHAQLLRVAKECGMQRNHSPAQPEAVHRSLLAGLLSQLGVRQADTREYLGARGTKFAVWPGSGLARRSSGWVMAAELVETSRLWARTVAKIDPAWAESLAEHLVRRSYSEPRWSRRRGTAVAQERVTLYGLPLVADRTVPYARVDAALAREMFIRHALVEQDWETHHQFLAANHAVRQEIDKQAQRVRRRDLVVSDDALFDFYDARLPADIGSARHFESWWKRAKGTEPQRLRLRAEDLGFAEAHTLTGAGYPEVWVQGDVQLSLSYEFSPGTDADGLNVDIPLGVLNRIVPGGFDWLVAGLREELVIALLRSLDKQWRRCFVPVPDVARATVANLIPSGASLISALSVQLQQATGVAVPAGAWHPERLPGHLRATFRVRDGGEVIAQGQDLVALQRQLAGRIHQVVAAQTDDVVRSGALQWDFGTLPQIVRRVHDGHTVEGFPALVDEGGSVGVQVLASPAAQRRSMWLGTRRLLLLASPGPVRTVTDQLSKADKLVLTRNPHGSVVALLDDCAACAVDEFITANSGPAWDAQGFAALRDRVAAGLNAAVLDIVGLVTDVLAAGHELDAELAGAAAPAATLADVAAQLGMLRYGGFVAGTGRRRLPDIARYLRAATQRLRKAALDPVRDAQLFAEVAELSEELGQLRARLGGETPATREIMWLLQELRVSLFAQQLGTRQRVSPQRIRKAITAAG